MSRKRQSRVATDHPVSMELALDNQDLLMQIFLFLPAKSLIRFKSVCKKWLSLISSDNFCHQHTLCRPKLQQSIIIQTESLQLFYLNHTTNGEKMMVPYSLSVLDGHQIVQASHGLLLLHSITRAKSYYVYNPTTRRLRKIILTKRDDFPCVDIALAFDPSKSPYYKVICFRSTAESYPAEYAFQIEVYNSESHTWKYCLKGFTDSRIQDRGLHFKNYIFWGSSNGMQFFFDIINNKFYVTCFNTGGPYEWPASSTSTYLQESDGHLYRIVIPNSVGTEERGVMWEIGDRLIPKYIGTLHNHTEVENGAQSLIMRPGGDGSTGSVITYEAKRRRIMAYNYLDQGSELFVDLTRQPVSEFDPITSAFQFGESLALV